MEKPHEFQKNYYELVAKKVLEKLWPTEFVDLKHADRPDLISTDRMIGVEVTRALNPNVAEMEAMLRRDFIGNFISKVSSKELQDSRNAGYTLITNKEFNRQPAEKIVGFSSPAVWHNTKHIQDAFAKKIACVNNQAYCATRELDLYIFTMDVEMNEENEVKELLSFFRAEQEKCEIGFRYVFLDDEGWFYKCDLADNKVQFYNTKDFFRDLCAIAKSEAMKVRQSEQS